MVVMATHMCTVLVVSMALLPVLALQDATRLRCYTCMGIIGGSDPNSCVEPNENTTTAEWCKAGEIFCKKRIVKAAGETKIERRCYDSMCTAQQGIAMGQQVYIDSFCCRDNLCNHGNRGQQPVVWCLTVLALASGAITVLDRLLWLL